MDALAYRNRLVEKGYSIPVGTDDDVDVTVEILLTARRLTEPAEG